jgi:hypothetical protein
MFVKSFFADDDRADRPNKMACETGNALAFLNRFAVAMVRQVPEPATRRALQQSRLWNLLYIFSRLPVQPFANRSKDKP